MPSDPAAPVAGTDVVERPPRRSDEMPPGSTAYWEALTGEMQGDITALRARVAELESERGELRTIVRVNALRHDPSLSHEEITAQLDRALRREPTPDPRDARIAALEAENQDLHGRLVAGDYAGLKRVAVLEAALRSVAIERFGGDLACTDYQQMRAWRANWQKCQDIARRALGDAHG